MSHVVVLSSTIQRMMPPLLDFSAVYLLPVCTSV